MQNLEIISVNIWNILISLANLVILFLILKHFLFKPVKKVMDERAKLIQDGYDNAEKAQEEAEENKKAWQKKLDDADKSAKAMLSDAAEKAKTRGDGIVSDAEERAREIIRRAEADAEQEKKKARAEMHDEIRDISTLLTEKLLDREINEDDQRAFIDSFIDSLGDKK